MKLIPKVKHFLLVPLTSSFKKDTVPLVVKQASVGEFEGKMILLLNVSDYKINDIIKKYMNEYPYEYFVLYYNLTDTCTIVTYDIDANVFIRGVVYISLVNMGFFQCLHDSDKNGKNIRVPYRTKEYIDLRTVRELLRSDIAHMLG